jgi:hypothetical protein
MQDPNQMTKYGKSMVPPVIYPLESLRTCNTLFAPGPATVPSATLAPARIPALSHLHLIGEMIAEDGQGVFQTLTPIKVKKTPKTVRLYKRTHQAHLHRLQQESSLVLHRPSSPETKLVATFIDLLHNNFKGPQPLLILGNWISSIPSRIGPSQMVAMAAQFFVHSFDASRDASHSNRTLALQTKGKALKELQLGVLAAQQYPTYDLLLATKLHYVPNRQLTDVCRSFSGLKVCIMLSTHLG